MDQDQPDLGAIIQALRAEIGSFREEQIATLRKVHELSSGIVEVQTFLKTLTPPAAPPVVPPPSSPEPSPRYSTVPNPPMPKKFSGDPLEFSTFITQCKLHFLNKPRAYDTDGSKVLFILMNMEGSALSWATPYIDKGDPILDNYAVFLESFSRLFERKLDKDLRIKELLDIKQGKTSLIEYLTKFHIRAAESKWPEDALIKLYYKGLNEEIKDSLSRIDPLPTSFVKYLELTVQLDQRMKERKKEKSKVTSSQSVPLPISEQPIVEEASEEEPMQIGVVSPLHYASEGERRRMEHLCFYCGANTHFISQCPLRNQRNLNLSTSRHVPSVKILQEKTGKGSLHLERYTHQGVTCDACLEKGFSGKRYKCLTCLDYDLCEDCYTRGTLTQNHTKAHKMRCILNSAPKAKTTIASCSPVSQKWVTIEEDSGSDNEFDTPFHLSHVKESPKLRHVSAVRSQAACSVAIPPVCLDKGFSSEPPHVAKSSMLSPSISTHMTSTHNRPTGLVVAEKERRRAENLCFYCGDARHFLVLCPHRPPRQYDAIVTPGRARSTIQASIPIDTEIADTMIIGQSLEANTSTATSPATKVEEIVTELPKCNTTPTTEIDPVLFLENAIPDDDDSDWEEILTPRQIKKVTRYGRYCSR